MSEITNINELSTPLIKKDNQDTSLIELTEKELLILILLKLEQIELNTKK